jgi:hypothetical protein
VGAEEGDGQVGQPGAAPQPGQEPDGGQLAFAFQVVAGLGFDGGRAAARPVGEPGRDLRLQLVRGGGAGGPHGRLDPAGLPQLGVGRAGRAQCDLREPATGVDRVGVGVDQAGGDEGAAEVEGLRPRAQRFGQVGGRAGPGDVAAVDRDGGVGNHPRRTRGEQPSDTGE